MSGFKTRLAIISMILSFMYLVIVYLSKATLSFHNSPFYMDYGLTRTLLRLNFIFAFFSLLASGLRQISYNEPRLVKPKPEREDSVLFIS